MNQIKRRKDFKPLNDIGKKYGHLTVLKLADTDKKQSGCRILYECLCDCGRKTLADRWALQYGHKKRCEYCSEANKNKPTRAYDRNIQINNTSGYKGIDFHCGQWRARITYDNKTYLIGEYPNIEDAVVARKSAELMTQKLKSQ